MNNILETIERILDGYKSMDARRKRILFVFVAVSIIAVYIGSVAFSNYNYEIYKENIPVEEVAEISAALNASNTDHKVTNNGTTILVKKGQADQITVDLAMAGIVSNGGFTIDDFANKITLGTTKQDRMLYTQEYYQSNLERQIKMISGITNAEVNINLGSGSKFLGNSVESSASVIITTVGTASSGTVSGIQALVSGYMGNINADEVSVIDQSGQLLSGFNSFNSSTGIMDNEFQIAYKTSFEQQLLLNLNQQLQRVYGPGKVSIAVDYDLDFSHKEVTVFSYDEDGRILNEQLTQSYDGELNGNLVDPNTEPDPVEVPEDAQTLLNLVRNWTYGNTQTTQIIMPGTVKRISISAVYDGSLTDEELDQLSGMIQAASGFDSERGDLIYVAGIPFAEVDTGDTEIPGTEATTYYFFPWLTNDLLIGMAAMGGLVMLLLLFMLTRGRKKKAAQAVVQETPPGQIELPDELESLTSSTDSEFGTPEPIVETPYVNPFENFQLSQTQMERLPGLVDRDIIQTLSGAGEVKEIIKQFVNATKKLFDDDIDNAIELVRIMMNDVDDPRRALESTAELLIILGQDYSSVIMKKLTEEEMLKLVQEISHIRSISSSEMIQALSEFANIYDANKYIRKGGIEYAKKLLVSTMGEEYANKLTDKIKRAQNGTIRKPFNSISDVDSNKILNILAGEHPQTISLVLAYLNPMTAAKVMSSLPKDLQIDVTLRLATMNTASAEVITAIEGMVEDKVANMTQSAYTDVGGIQAIADIINNVERTTQRNILEQLAVTHPKISARIRESLFVFEDILTLSDADVQVIMRDIEHKVIATSFKGVSEDLQSKIIGNVSKRNREIIESEAELLGPVSVREIEEAQAVILYRIQELDDEGTITIEKAREDINDYVY
jgi:flagellar motor switch protein FliG